MKRTYITNGQLETLASLLGPRTLAILDTLLKVRLATGCQLERLHFADVSRRQATGVLARLVDQRLLVRLPRVIGGERAGSAGFTYGLDVAGRRLTEPNRPGRYRRPWSVGTPFLAHTLAVTEVFVRLVEAERTSALKAIRFDTEPACWRPFAGPGGARTVLKPDAFLVATVDGFADRWFLELDRGTESRTTLARKCDLYRSYWQTGTEQHRSQVFPRVLWLVPDEARQATLIDVFGRQPEAAWPLFTVALQDEAVSRIVRGAHL